MVGIKDFLGSNPWPEVTYVEMDSILGKQLTIKGVTPFENEKNGKGVHILIDIDDDELRLCTHAVGITNTLSKQSVLDHLRSGETIECTIVKGTSKNGRPMYRFGGE